MVKKQWRFVVSLSDIYDSHILITKVIPRNSQSQILTFSVMVYVQKRYKTNNYFTNYYLFPYQFFAFLS